LRIGDKWTRKFLKDGDEVSIKAYASDYLGFGTCTGRIVNDYLNHN
jgi:2-keto-4-pentenoate hydratase/2-oxohepta-3-ene-1,7-dioic acid hydratase in catechol pathway